VAQVAVCSQINIKHINTVWAELTVVECWTWCITWPAGFKRLMQFLRTCPQSRSNKNKQYQRINLKPSMLYAQYTSIKISIWDLFVFLRAWQDLHVCHCSALNELCFLSTSVRYRTDSWIIGSNSTLEARSMPSFLFFTLGFGYVWLCVFVRFLLLLFW
jgi:hypothetical protein